MQQKTSFPISSFNFVDFWTADQVDKQGEYLSDL